MHRVELADFLLIAEAHAGIAARDLARMPRVMQIAQAALAAPFSGFGAVEFFPSLGEKAAVYAFRIITYHPLPDGNKRAGYDVMREFIERNGAVFTHPPGGLADTAQMIEDVAAGVASEATFTAWVLERLEPPAP
ncbi:Fic family protein [Solirubrobacter ginsenosidimutans]|uniref:Fic family protein n=1 Tax=Solirubrobacter ginsenosidimutans TaxID=490573 RepID=A0A9X3MTU3_9ACTN|nr:Fic family protein [Solirubrobacter ginsenosidimutans]MDA0161135.1 Fic family protein [Solirubrobacter ginsenosidimutans]